MPPKRRDVQTMNLSGEPGGNPAVSSDSQQAWRHASSIGADPTGPNSMKLGMMPLSPGDMESVVNMLQSIGKPISEMLGTVLRPTTPGTGLPSRLSIGGFDSGTGKATIFAGRKGGETFDSTVQQLDDLLNSGQIDIVQPPKKEVGRMQAKISSMLDAAGNGGQPPTGGSVPTPEALDAALQGIHDAVPTDATGNKLYNLPPKFSPEQMEQFYDQMIANTPKGPSGRPITNPGGVLVDDIMDLPIMKDVPRVKFEGASFNPPAEEAGAYTQGYEHGKTGYGFQKSSAGRKGSPQHQAYRQGYDHGVDDTGR